MLRRDAPKGGRRNGLTSSGAADFWRKVSRPILEPLSESDSYILSVAGCVAFVVGIEATG